MNRFVAKFRDVVKGILTGFDRIVFKGSILPLARAGFATRISSPGPWNKPAKRSSPRNVVRKAAVAVASSPSSRPKSARKTSRTNAGKSRGYNPVSSVCGRRWNPAGPARRRTARQRDLPSFVGIG